MEPNLPRRRRKLSEDLLTQRLTTVSQYWQVGECGSFIHLHSHPTLPSSAFHAPLFRSQRVLKQPYLFASERRSHSWLTTRAAYTPADRDSVPIWQSPSFARFPAPNPSFLRSPGLESGGTGAPALSRESAIIPLAAWRLRAFALNPDAESGQWKD